MTPTRREEIRSYAERLRIALRMERVPVPVDEMVKLLGGRIVENAALSYEASITATGPRSFEIALRPWESPKRRRFSVAHELGHLFLHMGYLTSRWNNAAVFQDTMNRAGVGEQEYEAHEFAGALLMPADKFREVAQENLVNGRYDLPPIAEAFQVSLDAARTRGRWLNLFAWS